MPERKESAMSHAKWAALTVLLLLQAGDLLTTWIGIHAPDLHEIDGTSFGTLLVLKLAVIAVGILLCWRTKTAWVMAGATAVVYVPVIASNVKLIWGT